MRRSTPDLEFPVVSLTMVPRRIQHLKPTLVSLLRQRLPPQAIHLNLDVTCSKVSRCRPLSPKSIRCRSTKSTVTSAPPLSNSDAEALREHALEGLKMKIGFIGIGKMGSAIA